MLCPEPFTTTGPTTSGLPTQNRTNSVLKILVRLWYAFCKPPRTLKTTWPSVWDTRRWPRKGEPDNAAGKGPESCAERTALQIWNHVDTQNRNQQFRFCFEIHFNLFENRNYQFLKIKSTMWYTFSKVDSRKQEALLPLFSFQKLEVRHPKIVVVAMIH